MAEIITTVTINTDEAQANVDKLTASIEENNQSTKDAKKDLKELGDRTEENAAEYDKLSQKIALNKQSNADLNRERRASIKAIHAEKGSMEALKAQLAVNAAERNKLNLNTQEGADRAEELNEEMLELTEQLKEQEEAGGNFGRSVGNYASGFEDMAGALGNVNPALGGAIKGFKALQVQLVALMANPIVMIIAAIALALKAMLMWTERTAEGQEEMSAITARLGSYLESFFDIVSAIGGYLFKTFVPILEALVDQVFAVYYAWEALGKVMKGDFSGASDSAEKAVNSVKSSLDNLGEGVTNAVDGFGTMVDSMGKTISKADEVAKGLEEVAHAEFRLKEQIIENTVAQAKRRKGIAELILITRDETKSFEERGAALERSMELEKQNMAEKEAILAEELRIAQVRDAAHDSTIEDAQALADAEAKLLDFQRDSLNKQRELLNRQNELANKQRAEEKKRADEKKKEEEDQKKRDEEKAAEDQRKADEEAAKIEKEKNDARDLKEFKDELKAQELIDEQERADALVQLEKDKLERLLENEELNASEREILKLKSEEKQAKIVSDAQKKIDAARKASKDKEKKAQEDTSAARNTAISNYLSASQGMYNLLSQYANEHSIGMKALAIANAVINTWLGVTQALASSPPPASWAMAAVTLANGLTAVGNILSTRPDTSGGASSSGGGSIQTSVDTSAGGTVDTVTEDAQLSQEQALEGALNSANLQVSVTEFDDVQGNVTEADNNASI